MPLAGPGPAVYRAPVVPMTPPLWPTRDPDISLLPHGGERTVPTYRIPAELLQRRHTRPPASGQAGRTGCAP